jgi:hypothetical protein
MSEIPLNSGEIVDTPPHDENGKFTKGHVKIGGRTEGQRNYSTIYREALLKLAATNNKEPDDIELEIVSKGLLNARSGDYRFYKDVLDRLHGTATQKADVQVKTPPEPAPDDIDLDELVREVSEKLRQKKTKTEELMEVETANKTQQNVI